MVLMMKKKYFRKYFLAITLYLLIAVCFQWIAGDQLRYKIRSSVVEEKNATVGELSEGTRVSEELSLKTDTLDKICLSFSNYGRVNSGYVSIILKQEENILFQTDVQAEDLKDNVWYEIKCDLRDQEIVGKIITLEVIGHSPVGASPSLYYSNLENAKQEFIVNGEKINGSLSYLQEGKIYYVLGPFYWPIVFIIGVILLIYGFHLVNCKKAGKKNWFLIFIKVYRDYQFLIHQLVSRDFKTKYKRSVLGYLWSFLNPLMTMGVQYIVFSTIFKSEIENFPVYLLSGVVFFSFFTEAVGLGLTSIVGNASLITKVYVPKYIYPVTRVLSSAINLLISLIPLFMLTILTGAKITVAIILLIVPLMSILVFCVGMSLILSTSMVFFRDTQYLWGIVSMAWVYMTPIFYPEDILPANLRVVLQCNPLYHIIKFVRVVLINGVSPEPIEYVFCIGTALVILLLGAIIFKKNQDKFVLYI